MTADVCLVLEGTYPFVTGGVSSWVHMLIERMPERSFRILHLSPYGDAYPRGHRYDVPDNVVGIDEIYLSSGESADEHFDPLRLREIAGPLRAFVQGFHEGDPSAFDALTSVEWTEGDAALIRSALLDTPHAWETLRATYEREATGESLLHFFWTWQFALAPLANILGASIPEAGCYHAVCTGYAGLLAARAAETHDRPMILTEHGIYTRERRIDIQRARWIPDWDGEALLRSSEPGYFRSFWRRQFDMMSSITYASADHVYTLYEDNRRQQIADGAQADHTTVIPNGISRGRFADAAERYAQRVKAGPTDAAFTVGFIGRICAIKDLVTLVRAARLAADDVPSLHVRLYGPIDGEPEYATYVQSLIDTLELQDVVTFEGSADISVVMSDLDVVVLSSISEAQPLVLLEAGAVGVPVIATDVGACRELINGRTIADRRLGSSGLIVPPAHPGRMAEAIVELATHRKRRLAMGTAAKQRVRMFYDQDDMIRAYDDVYARHERAARRA